MDVELLYCAGCPNWHLARERLGQALRATGHPDLEIRLHAVETEHEAQALCFPGSPTIRIGGRDPFPSPAQPHGLTCRVYATPDGLAGAPTVDQLVQALTGTS
ncbi:thioredoxin family protein [Streptomyces actuosus]|uniref:Thioredoxin family protein n=1 Tax=Streptomyces actuosus TaxID=1885 RepID=A0ABS2VNQ7_STRAS|nr:thioredoxin family protein [Streptomyces actuosus]MBN0044742.1 thioredoxin family protein [Streptomyces actuosus]